MPYYRVVEVESSRSWSRAARSLSVKRFVDGAERGVFVQTRQLPRRRQTRIAFERGRDREQAIGFVGKLQQPPADYLAYALGDAEFLDAELGDPALAVAAEFCPLPSDAAAPRG